MAQKFKPLTLSQLEEGSFIEDADVEFNELQKRLIAFCRTHRDKSGKATAVLTLSLKVKCEDPESGLFSVKSTTAKKMPTRPDGISVALVAEDDDGQEVLFSRESGADRGNPRQTKFATQDGRRTEAEV